MGFSGERVKEAGTADAMDLLIMSAMIGAIVSGSFLNIHVGTGSKPHVLFGDFPIFYNVTGLNWFERSK